MKAEIIAIGSEMLTPYRQDTNSLYLTEKLNALGVTIAFKTIVGDVKFGANGELAESRILQVQFQNVKSNDLAQFKDISTQVVVAPAEYESGKVIYPFDKAM